MNNRLSKAYSQQRHELIKLFNILERENKYRLLGAAEFYWGEQLKESIKIKSKKEELPLELFEITTDKLESKYIGPNIIAIDFVRKIKKCYLNQI